MSTKQADLEAIRKAFEQFAQAEPITLQLGADAGFFLLCQLQLALRHPANTGPTAQIIKDFALELQQRLVVQCPEAEEVIEKGWHPAFDQSTQSEQPRQRVTYQHLSLDVQEEVLANSYALGIACQALSKMSGYPTQSWISTISEQANQAVNIMPELAVVQAIRDLDEHREKVNCNG